MPPKSLPTAKPTLLGPRLPNRVQGQPFGVGTLPSQTKTLGQNPVSLLQPGPVQGYEQFNSPALPLEVSRALNQLQKNIQGSIGQVRADPTANKNLHENVVLTNGGTGGANPNVISHGLGTAYRGYRICTVKGGYIKGHSAIPPTTANPAQTSLLLWTSTEAFGSAPVTADVEIYG